MVTDLVEIRRLAESRKDENVAFRRHLRAHHIGEGPLHVIASEVQSQIDCTKCANCCRELTVEVSAKELAAIAAELGTTESEVKRMYTIADPSDPTRRIIAQRDGACVFLDGSLCMVYSSRPRPCRDFPHAALTSRSLGGRVESLCRKSTICPIIFNALEAYKHFIGFHYRPAGSNAFTSTV